jgi:hypothetical protein
LDENIFFIQIKLHEDIFLYKLICRYGVLENTFEVGQFVNLKDACPNELKQIDIHNLKTTTIIEASKL